MPVELVRVETSDGLRLDGAFAAAAGPPQLPADVFLLVHGTGGSFYSGGLLERFAQQAVERGAAVLRVNTRGHDGLALIPGRRGPVRGGAAYETIDDCRHDLAAWIDFLAARGYRQIVVAGHSMGAVKAIYAAAHEPRDAMRAVVAISPPRLCHARLSQSDAFQSEFARAEHLVAEGQPDALLPVSEPLSFVTTAAGYVEKYGPSDRYDFVPWLERAARPVLVLIGGQSMAASVAFGGLAETLAEPPRGVTVEMVAEADIQYRGCQDVPFERAAGWLASL